MAQNALKLATLSSTVRDLQSRTTIEGFVIQILESPFIPLPPFSHKLGLETLY